MGLTNCMDKKEKRSVLKYITGVLLLVFFIPTTHAVPPGPKKMNQNKTDQHHFQKHRHGEGPPNHGDVLFEDFTRMKKELRLTKVQIAKLTKLNKYYVNRITPITDKLRQKLKSLHTLLQKPIVDLAGVRDLLEQMSPHRIDILMLKIQHRLKSDKILTDKQRDILRNKRK